MKVFTQFPFKTLFLIVTPKQYRLSFVFDIKGKKRELVNLVALTLAVLIPMMGFS